MAQGNPLPGEKYLHFKNKLYQVTAIAYHSETMERYVVYQALYGDFRTFIRPYDMFISEVDREKYPQATQKYRFEYQGNLFDETAEKGKTAGTAEEENAVRTAEKRKTAETAREEKTAETTREEKTGETEKSGEGSGTGVNPWLLRFLDADNFEEKYKIVCDMQAEIDDRLIDDIAVVMDLAIPEGKLSDRYAQLKYCMRTRHRYENGRLR